MGFNNNNNQAQKHLLLSNMFKDDELLQKLLIFERAKSFSEEELIKMEIMRNIVQNNPDQDVNITLMDLMAVNKQHINYGDMMILNSLSGQGGNQSNISLASLTAMLGNTSKPSPELIKIATNNSNRNNPKQLTTDEIRKYISQSNMKIETGEEISMTPEQFADIINNLANIEEKSKK